ncbi:MAG: hypothetical protein A2075_19590 [Geobacteraceae bacterium GWC2_58_44]|nr:MAG: hypothetical protein A2075_19590 [Geobacteraceae bacterium GWC2_58_44]HBG04742.1 hypothetical protein [Geobacter sp.]
MSLYVGALEISLPLNYLGLVKQSTKEIFKHYLSDRGQLQGQYDMDWQLTYLEPQLTTRRDKDAD